MRSTISYIYICIVRLTMNVDTETISLGIWYKPKQTRTTSSVDSTKSVKVTLFISVLITWGILNCEAYIYVLLTLKKMYQTCTTYELYCLMYQMLKHLLVVSYTVYLFTSKFLSRVLIGFSILDYRTGFVWKHYHQVNILISYVLVLLLNTIPFVGNN